MGNPLIIDIKDKKEITDANAQFLTYAALVAKHPGMKGPYTIGYSQGLWHIRYSSDSANLATFAVEQLATSLCNLMNAIHFYQMPAASSLT